MPGIDLHTHLAPRLDHHPHNTDGLLLIDGRPVGPPDLYRPDRLVSYLDTAGLDEAVVTIPRPFSAKTWTPRRHVSGPSPSTQVC